MKRLKQELVITQAQHESQLSQLEEVKLLSCHLTTWSNGCLPSQELERVKLTRDDVASVSP